MTDEEALFAYIDGELEGEDRKRIEAKIAADPALQEMVVEHRALAGKLRGAFSTLLDAPIPEALSMTAAADATVASMAERRSRRDLRRSSWSMSHWAAMAATLVAGIIGGAVFSSGGEPVTERDGQLVASNWLEDALDAQLAGTQDGSGPVRIGLTFRKDDGAICRSFAAEATEGVACREGKLWQLRGLLHRERVQTGDYRLAASSGTADLIDGLIVGEALDQKQERAARAAGWSPAKTP